jgi:hypothetical protein
MQYCPHWGAKLGTEVPLRKSRFRWPGGLSIKAQRRQAEMTVKRAVLAKPVLKLL